METENICKNCKYFNCSAGHFGSCSKLNFNEHREGTTYVEKEDPEKFDFVYVEDYKTYDDYGYVLFSENFGCIRFDKKD